jgi:uncharacterized protein YggT (Ycf19 family)
MKIAEKTVYIVFSVIETLLVLRVLFKMFGANPDNGIAKFIYGFSNPLYSPFSGLFKNLTYGRFIISLNSITALVLYTIAGFIIIEIIFYFSQREEERIRNTRI